MGALAGSLCSPVPLQILLPSTAPQVTCAGHIQGWSPLAVAWEGPGYQDGLCSPQCCLWSNCHEISSCDVLRHNLVLFSVMTSVSSLSFLPSLLLHPQLLKSLPCSAFFILFLLWKFLLSHFCLTLQPRWTIDVTLLNVVSLCSSIFLSLLL